MYLYYRLYCIPKTYNINYIMIHYYAKMPALLFKQHRQTTMTRFELARDKPNWFQVSLLNHSDTLSTKKKAHLPTKVRWATALRIGIEPMTQIHHVLTCSRLTVWCSTNWANGEGWMTFLSLFIIINNSLYTFPVS